jgi:hypothetical protein
MRRIFIFGILVCLVYASDPQAQERSPKLEPALQKPSPLVVYVNTKSVILEYELGRVGPSGIGSVEIWWTRDNGKTWDKAPNPDQPDEKINGRFQRVLELLGGDGAYGFSVVVRSGAGRAKKSPQPGEAPQFRVELDTTPPEAKLLPPKEGDPGTVILSWKAQDKNLTAKPISLEWSERHDGPWQSIAANLANTGRYVWKLSPQKLPMKVFLRLRARDRAGNEGIAVTVDPQGIDFFEPEGRVTNVFSPKADQQPVKEFISSPRIPVPSK